MSSYFLFVLALKTIEAQILFWSVFLKKHKKRYQPPKTAKMAFLFDSQELFLCVFKNTDQKNICASIVFKDESKPKREEIKFFLGLFFKNQKRTFSGVQNSSF